MLSADRQKLPGRAEAGRADRRRATASAGFEPAQESPAATYGFPWRGLLTGLTGVCVLSFVTPYADSYLQASGLSATYLPTGVFLLFLLLLAVNRILVAVRVALSPPEVMLAYVTMVIPSAVPSDGMALRLVPLLVQGYYYQTPVNEWAIRHLPHIPRWMTPHGDEVVTWFFTGLPQGHTIPWEAWIRPLTLWALLVLSLYLMMASLCFVLRKRWMDEERLQFPLAQVPLMLLDSSPGQASRSLVFRSPLLWYGAAIPIFIHGLNGLHLYVQAIPVVTLTDLRLGTILSGSQFLADPPFYRWADVRFNFYWSVVGISYFLRSEVSLSVWVFEWLYNLEDLAFEISGVGHGRFEWTPLHSFGFTLMSRYQRIGAIIVVSAVFLWASRNDLRETLRAAIGRRRTAPDAQSVPWWTLWAFVGGMIVYFAWTAATGMKPIASVLLLFFFLIVSLTAARIVAATGILWLWDFFMPLHGLSDTVGTARVDPHTWTNVGVVSFGTMSSYNNTMPQTLDSMKIVRQAGVQQHHFVVGMALGLVVALGVSFATVVWLAYTYGGQNLNPWHFKDGGSWLLDRVAAFDRYHTFTNWPVLGCMTAGGATMGLLLYLHRTYLWWPLYPLGFIVGGMRASAQMWFPVFLGWALKRVVLRFGGVSAYNRLKDVALGFVLGEFLSVGIWLVIDAIAGTTLHRVFPAWAPS